MIKMLSLSGIDNYQVIYRGRLEAESLRHLRRSLDQIWERGGNVHLITRVDELPSLQNISSLIELLRVKRSAGRVIRKYAILTSKDWVRHWAMVANRTLRCIDIRAFEPEDAPSAITWLNERN